MDVTRLRNYGAAFSDAESTWPPEMKAKMRRDGKAVVMRNLGLWERVRFGWAFLKARRRAAALDLAPFRARGMTNEPFLAQQLEYLALFAALAEVSDTARAVRIMKEVMDETAREPLLHCLPPADDVRAAGEPFEVLRAYFQPAPEAGRRAGCTTCTVTDEPDAWQMDVTWCVWVELAKAMGVPEACIPNCYADDLVFPEYFRALGITYRRTGTLALGAHKCDFRFERATRG
ncbi:MAG: L-2-amino-thiazoline-4-carboxylic acid hydrolase [Myxococcota bacterium]